MLPPDLRMVLASWKEILATSRPYSPHRCVDNDMAAIEPHVKEWFGRYRNEGLVVIGVHTPEFDQEKKPENVAAYLRKHAIAHPVAMDNDYANWNRFENRYWPAFYLRDRKGVIRYVYFGEGRYRETDAIIRALLAENH